MTNSTIYDRNRFANTLTREGLENASHEEIDDLCLWIQNLKAVEIRAGGRLDFKSFIKKQFAEYLDHAGITSGRIAEIGGPFNSFASDFPEFEFEYLSLYPVDGRDDVIVADITQCDYVEAERYDAIFSVSVLEHVSKPWLAAEHMSRILKPGGVMYHAAPFSYFYHGAPADFWRYTPDALKILFSDLNPLLAEFYGENRRRDNRGSKTNAVDRDGGKAFALDAFGGWRENWYSLYCGQKDADYLAGVQKQAECQVIVNLVKYATLEGMGDEEAMQMVKAKIKDFKVSRDGELSKATTGEGMEYSLSEIQEIWTTRSKNTISPNYSRFIHGKRAGI